MDSSSSGSKRSHRVSGYGHGLLRRGLPKFCLFHIGMPLDDEGRILGVVTARDLIELLGEKWGEDYAKLGGLSSEEDLSEPVLRSVRKRSPWLLLVRG